MSGSLREEIKFQSRKAEIIGNSMKCKINEKPKVTVICGNS